MSSVICTLFEGNYHYGVAALANSLYKQGYRGSIFAGYKGKLPSWTSSAVNNDKFNWTGLKTLHVKEDLVIHFVPLDTEYHLTNYKPHFIKDVVKFSPNDTNFFYFDPDIVVIQKWSLFERWAQLGVCFCQDVNYFMPSNHVSRAFWLEYAKKYGYTQCHELHNYFNGGYVGFKREHISLIDIWCDLLDKSILDGETKIHASWHEEDDYSKTFGKTEDQDIMNLAMMVSDMPLSIAGPDAMGFQGGRKFMLHSIGSPKAWDISWKHAFKKRKVSISNLEFFNNINSPINISELASFKVKVAIKLNVLK